MLNLKCQNCGGTMQADEENEYAVCEYCGAKQKIEKNAEEVKSEILKKRERERIERNEKIKQNTKSIGKKIKKIILIIIIFNIVCFALFLILGFCGVFDDDSATDNLQTSENSVISNTSESPESNYDNNIKNSEPIEITDLFYDGLEKAEELLEAQSKSPQDIEAYTRYTFNCVAVMCEYGTNSIYSISVDFTNKNTNVDYTVFGLTKNTTRMNWDSALGEMYYQGYDSDGNPVYSYELEYNGNTYSVEVTATSDTPDKITVYKQYQ